MPQQDETTWPMSAAALQRVGGGWIERTKNAMRASVFRDGAGCNGGLMEYQNGDDTMVRKLDWKPLGAHPRPDFP